MSTILTDYDPPPIPLRQFDWNARREGSDEGDPIGYGRTEDEAIADLLSLEDELAPTETTTDLMRSLFTPFGAAE